jgi:thiamine-monophosphate kinase
VLAASGVGVTIDAPAAASLLACTAITDDSARLGFVLAGGDDYELLFTAPAVSRDAVTQAAARAGTRVTRIGRIEAERGFRVVDAGGRKLDREFGSFDHFG